MIQEQRIDAPAATVLRDGRAVTIRPLLESDREALRAFGLSLPQDELVYLEDDLQAPEIIVRLINAHAAENWRQVVAVTGDGTIVGYSSVRRLPGWSDHVGDVRLIVTNSWRRSGLGSALAQAIFAAAGELGVAKMMVDMLEKQQAGRAIFEHLGFVSEGLLTGHARDRSGEYHNLLIMSYHSR